ncbi:MAG: hypothetical protein ACM34L_03735 [Gemmatimonas sp.]|nr:hypothetical protein [Gemmatimonadaceae bacterium]
MTRGRARLALVVALCVAHGAPAQVIPNAHWRTIDTRHFHVHFTPALEPVARRAAVSAERAYAKLAAQLVEPRGPIDLVVADNVDFANGSTTPFPTNRVVVYAHPPLDDLSLRFYDDWLALVITHELTHVFHLDRTRGWWRVAQRVFGRSPALFPNFYLPAWVTEGLAVYYESDLTGFGRVEGTYEPMIVTSTARAHGMLGIDRWSLATTRFPYGDIAYGEGALFMDYLARTRGAPSIPRFVERSSGTTIPFRLNHMAKQGFGISFKDAWRRWADSVEASTPQEREPFPGWRDVTKGGYFVGYPRWEADGSLLYVASNGRQSPALERVRTDGSIERLSRRNGVTMNVPLADGSVVYSQLDLVNPYEDRFDLYRERNGSVSRLTHGARLTSVDARADGEMVAVRFDPGTTSLVRVRADGTVIRALTSISLDTEWAEPRWSRRGDRIAATRWTRGGYTQIVVLDTLGHVLRELTRDRASNSQAEWSRDDLVIVYASDRTGVSQLWAASADGNGVDDAVSEQLTDVTTGLFWPAMSPDGHQLAAVRWESDGYHVGVAPLGRTLAGWTGAPLHIAKGDTLPAVAPLASTAPSHGYSPWRSLLPRYWLPLVSQNSVGGYTFGAFTSGSDVVNRHAYYAQLLVDFARGQHAASALYSYAGLGQPVLQAGVDQYWDAYRALDSGGAFVGDLFRRTRDFDAGITFSRPRARTNAFLSMVGTYEQRDYTTDPAPLISRIVGLEDPTRNYWILASSAGWSNAQASALSISPEDGVAIGVSGRLKWLEGGAPIASKNVSASISAYKSIDAGGFARHVIAVRAAAGVAGGAEQNEFDLGGASGANIDVLPGLSLGSRRTFAVRGFPVGVESGTHIVAGSLEYRLPLTRDQHGFGSWPMFLDRTSLSVFGDAGSASGGFDVSGSLADNWIASAGAELGLNLAVPYDVPYLLRIGMAAPVINHSGLGVRSPTVYVRLGVAF